MSTLRFEFVAQDHIVYEGDVNMVIIPGADGVIGILPKHAPLMAVVSPGEVVVKVDGQEDEYFAVGGGFVEVRPDKVVLVARSGESAAEIDAVRAEMAMRRAEEYLASPERERDKERSMSMAAALRRSRVRLNIYRRRGRGPRRPGDRPSAPPPSGESESE
ncbi:MAG TPA: ATP synthase F1 subunit epsilon [Caldilineae bacterium]|nr:ATP synthase F1 subunit epsilon [Caldilineae bacterium]